MHHLTRTTALTTLAALLVLGPGLAGGAEKKAGGSPKAPATTLAAGIRLEPQALARHIDQLVERQFCAEKVQPSPLAGDAEFLRRVYVDITGHIPPADRTRNFLESRDPNKRVQIIDELLATPAYGKHQADIWQALLLPRNSDNRRLQGLFGQLTRWLEDGFNRNRPWDRMVHDLLTASGDTVKNGAVVYFLANPTPDKLTDSTTRLFLGVRLERAQCHNHPFTDWKQNEYWGMAAFFTKVRTNGRPAQVVRNGGTLAVSENGPGRPARLPVSAKVVPPKFLQGEAPKLATARPYRPVLADWMVRPDNPFFSRALVNRTWAQLFGRGIVNPVDDMHDGNPPSHPELLADLAGQFTAHDFDLKYLVRAVCNSRAYQRTSKPFAGNAEAAPELFSRMAVKPLTPVQLYDSLTQVLNIPNNQQGRQGRRPAAQRPLGNNPRAAFVAFFQVEDGADPTEYQGGIPQALRLMNAPLFNNTAMLNPLLRSGQAPAQVVGHLYLAALSRHPNPGELNRILAYVRQHQGEARQAYADVLWALLNSSEFALNH